MCLNSVPWARWQLTHCSVRFALRGSFFVSPIGCEECFCQSWHVPHSSIPLALTNMSGMSDECGSWHLTQLPSRIGSCFVGESSWRRIVSAWQVPQTVVRFPFTRPFCGEACGA